MESECGPLRAITKKKRISWSNNSKVLLLTEGMYGLYSGTDILKCCFSFSQLSNDKNNLSNLTRSWHLLFLHCSALKKPTGSVMCAALRCFPLQSFGPLVTKWCTRKTHDTLCWLSSWRKLQTHKSFKRSLLGNISSWYEKKIKLPKLMDICKVHCYSSCYLGDCKLLQALNYTSVAITQ